MSKKHLEPFYETFNSPPRPHPFIPLEPGSWDLPRINKTKLEGWLCLWSDPPDFSTASATTEKPLPPFLGCQGSGRHPTDTPRGSEFGLTPSFSWRQLIVYSQLFCSRAPSLQPRGGEGQRGELMAAVWTSSTVQFLSAIPHLHPLTTPQVTALRLFWTTDSYQAVYSAPGTAVFLPGWWQKHPQL